MRLLLVTFAGIGLALCSACSKPVYTKEEAARILALQSCENVIIQGQQVKLCFDSVITDSRCPANAICVWRGFAAARFTFSANGQSASFDLAEFTDPNFNYPKDTTVFGYKIEFVNLYPYPGTVPSPVPPAQIKAEVEITKL